MISGKDTFFDELSTRKQIINSKKEANQVEGLTSEFIEDVFLMPVSSSTFYQNWILNSSAFNQMCLVLDLAHENYDVGLVLVGNNSIIKTNRVGMVHLLMFDGIFRYIKMSAMCRI